jgi:hypothetical protein
MAAATVRQNVRRVKCPEHRADKPAPTFSRNALEHRAEKWEPVFGKNDATTKT